MRIGRLSGASGSHADMEFAGAGVWRRPLTVAELAAARNALLGLPGY
jgi:hypothetical protein